jgi:hypothetical protein
MKVKREAVQRESAAYVPAGTYAVYTVTVGGSRWGEIFHTRPDRPWGPPSLLYNGYRVFLRWKAAGA